MKSSINYLLVLLALIVAFACAQNGTSRAFPTTSKPATTTIAGAGSTPKRPTTTATGRQGGRVKPCIKHPANFQQLSLPCGGFQKLECLQECKGLGHTRAYCTQREHFCLCHSGDLYSC